MLPRLSHATTVWLLLQLIAFSAGTNGTTACFGAPQDIRNSLGAPPSPDESSPQQTQIETPETDRADAEEAACEPVVFTTQQDHQHLLGLLGIQKLRPGRNASSDQPNAANYDEALANPYPRLPELMRMEDGTPVTSANQWWQQRRPEIVKLFEREVYGSVPEDTPTVRWRVLKSTRKKLGNVEVTEQRLAGVVDNSRCPEIPVTVFMEVTLPEETEGPVPVLMQFGFTMFDANGDDLEFENRRFPGSRGPSKAQVLAELGWGCATLNAYSVQQDSGGESRMRFGPQQGPGGGLTRGIIGLCNLGQPRTPEQWGALRAWAWGASRGLDYLQTMTKVDGQRVAIDGVSRFGKAALVTMAFDTRFAAVLVGSSGKGGATLLRRNFGESVENLAGAGEYHWMAGNFVKYAAEQATFGSMTPDDLPVDSHMLIALCAPRPTFISYGVPEQGDAHWLDHRGSFMAAIAAQPAFRLLGVRDLGRSDDYLEELPPSVGEGLLDGHLAWRQHHGGHTDMPNIPHFVHWVERLWSQRGASERTSTSAVPRPQVQREQRLAGKRIQDEDQQRSLRAVVGPRFKIGVGVGRRVLDEPADQRLLLQHFQCITPENCMKPQSIHPQEARWHFEDADRFAAFVRDHQLELVGHCLVWAKDDRTARWMMEEDGHPVSRDTLLSRIENHVRTVVQRYAAETTMWDVVNEALGDSDEELLRESVYSRTTGIDFIVTAFKVARQYDPTAVLIYNDYNGHKPEKRQKLLTLLRSLKEAGTPIDAYGMQGHFELGDDSITQLRETFEALRELGIQVAVSELDIDVVGRSKWWAENGKYRDELAVYDPYRDGLPDEVQRQLAEQYLALFRLFDEYHDIIVRVSFWNLHDGQSWLNYFPWRRVNHPLLFDRQRQPKLAFDVVYEFLAN